MPRALAISITLPPMLPAPTTPSVLPFTSVWLTPRNCVKLERSPFSSARICFPISEERFSSIMTAVCATRSVE